MALSDKVWSTGAAREEDLKASIIALLDTADHPVGTRDLSTRLQEYGISMSPSTTARRLRDMDGEGLTAQVGTKGRVLTSMGTELARKGRRAQTGTRLVEAADIQDTNGLVNLLVVRRAIEPETLLDATASVTQAQLEGLRSLVAKHSHYVSMGESLPPHLSLAFHRAAAEPVQNPLLRELHGFIFNQDLERVDTALDLILEGHRHSAVGVDEHRAIVDAMASSDGLAAAQLMREHLDRLIAETNQFIAERGGLLIDALIARGRGWPA